MPLAPFSARSYCTVELNALLPMAAYISVLLPLLLTSKPVTSWRWPAKASGRHGPLQVSPPLYDRYSPVLVPATRLLLLRGSTATLPMAWYWGNRPAGSG